MWVYFWALYYVPLIYKFILQISLYFDYYQFSSFQSLSRVRLFATP